MTCRVAFTLTLLTVAALVTGCGQGEYDSRMDGAMAAAARRGGASGGGQGGPLATTFFEVRNAANQPQGLRFKTPSVFSTAKSLSAEPRAKLGGADIAGFCYTLEQLLDDDTGRKVPAYCYLFSVDKATSPPDQLHSAIEAAVSGMTGGATFADGAGNVPVKVLRGNGNSDFEVNGAQESLPSETQIYSFDTGTKQVVVAWRAADSVKTKNNFFAAVDAAMKSAEAYDPAAPAPMPMPMP